MSGSPNASPGRQPAAGEPNLRSALQSGIRRLAATHDTARLDAEVLLGHVLQRPRHYPYAWPDRPLAPEEHRAFAALIRRREQGEPIAYLTGRREFWSLDFAVAPTTLIPRPETEHLVEISLGFIPPTTPTQIVDLGTGCGAVAIALALERPQARITATDISPAALAMARANGRRLGAMNACFRLGSWCEPLAGKRYHLVVSNPPYVADHAFPLDSGDTRFEPPLALRGGRDGMDWLREISAAAPRYLLPGGRLVLEHGHDQARQVRDLLRRRGYVDIRTHMDHAGHARVTLGMVPATGHAPGDGAL